MVILNHAKIILVGVISAFVAITTSLLGITGTIIGSVISSVLYNVLSEALEKPVAGKSLNRNFEWEIAYVFPLIVIALIQLILIFALLAQWGFLPNTFLNLYLLLQDLVSNNLYRVLGFALLVMSIYPFILKPEYVNKTQGIAIAGVGLIFLARGFVDLNNRITDIYDDIFIYFDFPIAIIAFTVLAIIIIRIIISAYNSRGEVIEDNQNVRKVPNSINYDDLIRNRNRRKPKQNPPRKTMPSKIDKDEIIVDHSHDDEIIADSSKANHQNGIDKSQRRIINQSSDKIHFESNDLLDDYKR